MPGAPIDAGAASQLLSARAVRTRCRMVYAAGRADRLEHFRVDAARIAPCAQFVLDVMRDAYPALEIPYHSRWRHFTAGARDRWADLAAKLPFDRRERARVRFELAITSVLLDAGAGAAWRYRDDNDAVHARSEGLAVASFDLYAAGALSGDARVPFRADADALEMLDANRLARAFQVRADNPLAGLDGRVTLLRRLGAAVKSQPQVFGASRPRLGEFADHLLGKSVDGELPADTILRELLTTFGPIWPGRLLLEGVPLGDVWRHPSVHVDDATDRLVPFHKLSQWLAYSLVEPLEEAGIAVTSLDELTGLAEYRNGGLFLDTGVLVPRDPGLADRELGVDDEAVVEWRALTVALLDEVAVALRGALSLDARTLPLAKVLEGGTWAAGRRIAAERRDGGGPPLRIASDGTVF